MPIHFKILFLLFFSTLWVSCSNVEKIKDKDGNLLETYYLNDAGNKEGIYERYNLKGQIVESANFKNGLLDGERKYFYNTGEVEQVEYYKKDIIHGECNSYYKNGKIKLSYIYENGVMNSITKKYAENGILLEEVQMKNNEENGPFKEYHTNGKIKWEGEYLHGDNEYGLLKNYDESGVLIKKMMCDEHGVCQTIWTKEKGDIKPKDLNLAVNRE